MMSKSIYSQRYRQVLEKLKKARLEAGLTQKEVAKMLGKQQAFISKIEIGERRLDIVELFEFAKIYKKSINYFID